MARVVLPMETAVRAAVLLLVAGALLAHARPNYNVSAA